MCIFVPQQLGAQQMGSTQLLCKTLALYPMNITSFDRVAWKSIHPLPIMLHLDELRIMQKELFQMNVIIFITKEIKQNTVPVEVGYMSGVPAKSMYKSKFTGC